jgi:hypothetical protein
MRDQSGFFDIDDCLKRLGELGDQLEDSGRPYILSYSGLN